MIRLDLQFFGGRGASSASSGGGDPVLGKPGKPKTIDEALAASNPNYKQGRAYQVNCQRCVYAYELQRRGYDVEAMAAIKDNDPMGQNNAWMNGFQGQRWEGRLGTTEAAVEKSIINKMRGWGDGSRAVGYVAWKGGDAHVFNIESKNGRVYIFDGQTGKQHRLSDYINYAIPTHTMISRVDNLTPNNNVLQYAVKQKGK